VRAATPFTPARTDFRRGERACSSDKAGDEDARTNPATAVAIALLVPPLARPRCSLRSGCEGANEYSGGGDDSRSSDREGREPSPAVTNVSHRTVWMATRRWRRRLSSENAASFDGTGWRNMLLLMSRAEGDVLYQRATNRCLTPGRAQRVAEKGGERITFRHFDPWTFQKDLRVASEYS